MRRGTSGSMNTEDGVAQLGTTCATTFPDTAQPSDLPS